MLFFVLWSLVLAELGSLGDRSSVAVWQSLDSYCVRLCFSMTIYRTNRSIFFSQFCYKWLKYNTDTESLQSLLVIVADN